MTCSTTAAETFRTNRVSLGLSQSRLARLSGVSRFKICTFELGDSGLTSEERNKLRDALAAEAVRLSAAATHISFSDSESTESGVRDARLTEELAKRVMGWRVSPDRFLTGKGGWKPRWRFKPLENLADSLGLLEAASADAYKISADRTGYSCVRVQIAGTTGEGRAPSKARALTYALARAVGINVEETR